MSFWCHFFGFVLFFLYINTALVGGLGELFPANEEIQDICNEIRPEFETRVGKKISLFQAVEFRSQIVSGLNYFVKVQIGSNDYAFLRIFADFSGALELSSYQLHKTIHDELQYFEGDGEEKPERLVGSPGEIVEANPEIQKIADNVRVGFEKNLGRSVAVYKVVHFRTQVVSGKNYFIKLQIDVNDYAFLRIYQPLSGKLELTAFQIGKTEDDVVTYFEGSQTWSSKSTIFVGGVGDLKPATPEIQELVVSVQKDFEAKEGGKSIFKAVSFITQIVSGINYFVKVQVGDSEYVFLRIYKPLTGAASLTSYQLNRLEHDVIVYFE